MPQLEKPVLSNTLAGTDAAAFALKPVANRRYDPDHGDLGGRQQRNPRLYYFDQHVGYG